MPDVALLTLPFEVLELISGYLDSRGLSGFSRSCKTLRAPAGSSLFSNITLRFVDIEKLGQDLKRWSKTLDFNAGWNSVQRLEIHAESNRPPPLNVANLGDDPLEPWRYNADKSSPDWVREHDYDLTKLAAFLDCLPALTDVVWACSNQLPPSVLSALENDNRSRQLRLHLRTFCMRSLFTPIAVPIEVDSYEKRLATSPVLYSLAAFPIRPRRKCQLQPGGYNGDDGLRSTRSLGTVPVPRNDWELSSSTCSLEGRPAGRSGTATSCRRAKGTIRDH